MAKDIIQTITVVKALMNPCDSQIAASFIAFCEMAFCSMWIFTVRSAVCNVIQNIFFKYGKVHSVMCNLTLVVSTENFSLQES